MLQSRLLGDSKQWSSAVMTWSRLQGELANRRSTDIIKRADLGTMRTQQGERGSEEQREEDKKCTVEPEISNVEQRKEESKNTRLKTRKENGVPVLEKKNKTKEEKRAIEELKDEERKREEETSSETCPEAQIVGKKRKRNEEEQQDSRREYAEKDETFRKERSEEDKRRMVVDFTGEISGADFSEGSVCEHAAPGLNLLGSSSKRMGDIAVESVTNGNSIFIFEILFTQTYCSVFYCVVVFLSLLMFVSV